MTAIENRMHVYLTHPQVHIDPAVPVPRWGLNDTGRARTEALARAPWLRRFARIVASDETKAQETASILGAALGIAPETAPDLHENDRSATGFLPPPEFERMADAFFAAPMQSVRGWEPARAAQLRIVRAVDTVLAAAPDAATLFVGHGGVGTLLKCHCGGRPIARSEDQGGGGGGNHFAFRWGPPELLHDWRPMELPPP